MRLKLILAAMAFLGGPLAASPASQAHATGYTFTDINVPGSQPGSTGFLFPLGINNLGQVAGSYFDNAGNSDGFLYSGGKYVTIDAPGATDTYVSGINDWGQILGVSFYTRTGKSYVFLDTHGTFTNIADANAFSPISLNDRDQVLVYAGNSTVGVLNAHGVFTPIDTSGAGGGFVSFGGLNNLDQFVGTVSGHAFIDTKGVFTEFDYPNASFTIGGGINDWGQVVGVGFDSAGNGHGFLYTNGQFTTIDDPNAPPAMGGTTGTAINDLGQIAGFYYDAAGNFHSFLATPNLSPFASTSADPAVPEVSTWAMMLLGFAGLGFVGLRKTGGSTLSPGARRSSAG